MREAKMPWLSLTVLATSLAMMTACIPGASQDGPAGRGGADSIVAAIDGMVEGDDARPGIGYTLTCDDREPVQGKLTDGDDSKVSFPGQTIKDGDLCAMEVRAEYEENDRIRWFGKPVAKAKGLFYASSKAKVTGRKLSLKLYKVYSQEQAGEKFAIEVAVELELAEGVDMPAKDKTTAHLDCGDAGNFPGSYTPGDDAKAILNFAGLLINKLKEQTCHKVVVREQDGLTYNSDDLAEAIKLPTTIEADTTLSFPEGEADPFKLQAEDPDDLTVNGEVVGECLNFNVDERECEDVREVDLPATASYVIAEVAGKTKNGQGDEIRMIVGAGRGFDKISAEKFTAAALNEEIKERQGSYTFFSSDIENDLFGYDFDQNFIDGLYHTTFKRETADLADVEILHIEKVMVRGFHAVSAEELAEMKDVTWYGLVTATKEDEEDKQFIIAGAEDLLKSSTAPAGTEEEPKFFDLPQLLEEAGDDEAELSWAVYGLKDGAMAPDSCQAEAGTYRYLLHGHLPGADLAGQAELDACRVAKESIDSELSSWEASVKYWINGWHDLP